MKTVRVIISLLTVTCVFLMSSCMSFTTFDELTTKINETTFSYIYNEQDTTAIAIENTTAVTAENTTAEQTTLPLLQEETTAAPAVETTQPVVLVPETTEPPVIVPETTLPAVTEPDYSSYTKAEILKTYKEALEKTRSYTGALTVNHTESFDANVKDAHPGGALTELLANNIVKLVGSEGQQTLSFNGGKATNADGETVPVLLPQRTSFSLPEEGIKDASVSKEGDKLRIKMVLVPETVSMGEVPKYNSSAIGFLDTSGMDFKIITISRVDITYSGSVIDALIRSDGYIESVIYTINMSTYAELSGMGITGYGTLEGAQTEKWALQW